ncbi:MAG TPA: Na-translocating system protein MpsC family protein [Solirubrobacteraceae bacterium]|nr:Na-translocating system protein MpsC family protein [Solirubrobacteraceae bacterium]
MSADQQEAPHASVEVAISTEMVRLYKNQFGRGPTRARTEWAGGDAILTILEDTLTPAERNLVEMGEHERLRETRMFFQYATVREFCEPVERLTGRKVRAFISGIDTEANGLATELFVLHPARSSAPSRTVTAEPRAGSAGVDGGGRR